jgi:hypothetical protein
MREWVIESAYVVASSILAPRHSWAMLAKGNVENVCSDAWVVLIMPSITIRSSVRKRHAYQRIEMKRSKETPLDSSNI